MTDKALQIYPLATGLSVSREWPVEIFQASEGSEVRRPLLDQSQGVLVITANLKALDEEDRQRVLAAIQAGQEALIWVPIYTLQVRTTSPPVAGVVQAEGIQHGMKVGANAVITSPDGRKASKHEVTQADVGGIGLSPAPAPADYPAGSYVAPAAECYFPSSSRSHLFDWFPTSSVTMQELNPSTAPTGELPEIYKGLWVFGQGAGYEFLEPREVINADIDAIPAIVGASWQRRTRTIERPLAFAPQLTLNMDEPFETGLLWGMQDALGGAFSRLWVRSYIQDLDVLSIDGADVTAKDNVRALFEGRDRHVWDRINGTGHEVIDVQDGDPGEMVITLDPAPEPDAAIFEMLFLCRLMGDEVEMSTLPNNPRRWQAVLTFKELIREYGEVNES